MEIPPSIFNRSHLEIDYTYVAKRLVFRSSKDNRAFAEVIAIGESNCHGDIRYYAIKKGDDWVALTPDELVKLKHLNDRITTLVNKLRDMLNDAELITDECTMTEDEIILEREFRLSDLTSIELTISVTPHVQNVKYRITRNDKVLIPSDVEILYTAMNFCRYIHLNSHDIRKICEVIERDL